MHAFPDTEEGKTHNPRGHPWTLSTRDPNAKFTDFRKHPDLVRSSLEDFLPYADKPAIERFFRLVEWMNGPETIWETTESYFWPPASPHTSPLFRQYSTIVSGRLVFFARNYRWQCLHSKWLFDNLGRRLARRQPTPPNACVGVFTFPTLFFGLSTDGGKSAPKCDAVGVRCYGFGNSEDEAFEGLGLGVDAVQETAKEIADMLIIGGDLKP